MTLGSLIDEIIGSLAADSISPFPGFFTLVAIASAVLGRGWEGKRRTSGEPQLTERQLMEIRRYMEDHYEIKRSGRNKYYGGDKRR